MRWAILSIALLAAAILLALWSSGGKDSTPMLLIAMGITLFFSLMPLLLSKKSSPSPRPRTTLTLRPSDPAPKETSPRDR